MKAKALSFEPVHVEWLHSCAYAEYVADHALQTTTHRPAKEAYWHHRGCDLWQPAVLFSGSCAAAAV